MAKFDLGITDMDEFWDLTPGMFQALCKRRNIRIRYERYANALTASAVYNAQRHSEESPITYAFDFIRDADSSLKREKERKGKAFCLKVIGTDPRTRQECLRIRLHAIANLKHDKYENAEELFDSCWPTLKPTEEEKKEGY